MPPGSITGALLARATRPRSGTMTVQAPIRDPWQLTDSWTILAPSRTYAHTWRPDMPIKFAVQKPLTSRGPQDTTQVRAVNSLGSDRTWRRGSPIVFADDRRPRSEEIRMLSDADQRSHAFCEASRKRNGCRRGYTGPPDRRTLHVSATAPGRQDRCEDETSIINARSETVQDIQAVQSWQDRGLDDPLDNALGSLSLSEVRTTKDAAHNEPTLGTQAGVRRRTTGHSTLDFRIPDHVLQAARDAPPLSPAGCWSHKLYRSPSNKPVAVFLCTKKSQLKQPAFQALLKRFASADVLGFDLEWEPYARMTKTVSPKRLVSIVQLATEDAIAIFQLAAFYEDNADEILPIELRAILEASRPLKAGVNIAGDFRRLSKVFGVQGKGIFELSRLYRLVRYFTSAPHEVNNRLVALSRQVKDVLGLPLDKSAVRFSAWSQRLSKEQCDYAAADAYAGFGLFRELEARRERLVPVPDRPVAVECREEPVDAVDGQ